MIGPRTRLCGVIGHPVAHSLSPAIHNAALAHDGRDAVYLAFDVDPGGVADALRGLRELGAVGVNITVPHKVAAFELADRVDDLVSAVGAANTLVFGEDGVSAHNTDVAGVSAAVASLGVETGGRPWLVLGAGGAARAVAWAARDSRAGALMVANRSQDRADALVTAIRGWGHPAEAVPWAKRGEAAVGCGLIVNATSVGLDGSECPLEPEWVRGAADAGCEGVLDLVYRADETVLVRTARDAGLVSADGSEMLVSQAAEAYRLWWEVEAPIDVMRQAAFSALGRIDRRSGVTEVPPLV